MTTKSVMSTRPAFPIPPEFLVLAGNMSTPVKDALSYSKDSKLKGIVTKVYTQQWLQINKF